MSLVSQYRILHAWKVRVYGTVFTYESLTYQKSNKGAKLRIRLVTYTVNTVGVVISSSKL